MELLHFWTTCRCFFLRFVKFFNTKLGGTVQASAHTSKQFRQRPAREKKQTNEKHNKIRTGNTEREQGGRHDETAKQRSDDRGNNKTTTRRHNERRNDETAKQRNDERGNNKTTTQRHNERRNDETAKQRAQAHSAKHMERKVGKLGQREATNIKKRRNKRNNKKKTSRRETTNNRKANAERYFYTKLG